MLISVSKKFIFVANTKTASSSIEFALMPHADLISTGTPARRHVPFSHVLKNYPYLFQRRKHAPETFFKFGVMREPIDWISSWFRFRRGNDVESPLPADMDFAGFWAQRDWNIVRMNGRKHLQSQAFLNHNGRVLADMIIPYHRLPEFYPQIAKLLQVDPNLPHLNVSRLRPEGDVPDHLLDEVRAHYASDYKLWDQLDDLNAHGLERLRQRHEMNDVVRVKRGPAKKDSLNDRNWSAKSKVS